MNAYAGTQEGVNGGNMAVPWASSKGVAGDERKSHS